VFADLIESKRRLLSSNGQSLEYARLPDSRELVLFDEAGCTQRHSPRIWRYHMSAALAAAAHAADIPYEDFYQSPLPEAGHKLFKTNSVWPAGAGGHRSPAPSREVRQRCRHRNRAGRDRGNHGE
jgi:hypothetical protein